MSPAKSTADSGTQGPAAAEQGVDTRAAVVDALRAAQVALVAVHVAVEAHNASGERPVVNGERLLGYLTQRLQLALYRPQWFAVESRRIGQGTQQTMNDAALLNEVGDPPLAIVATGRQ